MARLPRAAGPIIWTVGVTLGHIVLPWSISLLATHHGWSPRGPGALNLFGLVPLAVGLGIIVSALRLHFDSGKEGWEFKSTPDYLLVRGPYRYTRNPMYVGAIAIWLGWALFYGSVAVTVGLAILWSAAAFLLVPFEERQLQRRWGASYANYKTRAPRWIGQPAR
ncbi:MAG TPA: isoprenylcysteine carboxylmethyltransferase family protein [Candidatus Binataceae bacterium]